jgi:formate hydrogenlyase subunit 3/multisubunit Na+/H+ antiporter MnhD subunit
MIKVGLLGWLRFLPLGEVALPAWSAAVVTIGLVSAFAGVAVGLTQRDPKANLAYSSVSQMGIITVLVGVALAEPEAAPLAIAAAAVYALHHGLAKGSLFLGVGIARREPDPGRRRLALAGLVLGAVSLAGLPLTSGALAKVALKDTVGWLPADVAGTVTLALSLAAVGTTVLMARLIRLVASAPGDGEGSERALWTAWVAVLVAVVTAAWVFPGAVLAIDLPITSPSVIWNGLWPVAVGLVMVVGVLALDRRRPMTVPAVPPGDAVVLVEAASRRLRATWSTTLSPAAAGIAARTRVVRQAAYRSVLPGGGVDRLDRRATRWRAAGAWFAVVALALLFSVGPWSGPPP